jgi:cytochrome c oxidase assembly protein subunit 15
MASTQALYDLSPLAQVLLTGFLLACGPLLWVWLRHGRSTPLGRVHALSLVLVFLTFDLIVFGAFTRLTDSGLGCPDWPGCYGQASPIGASGPISEAQQNLPTGPVTHGKAWIEMVHRYLATAVGGLIVSLVLLAWWQRRLALRHGQASASHLPWATLCLFWVGLQGAFGALTVTMKLFPAIVTMHLFGALVLLALLTRQAVRLGLDDAAQSLIELPWSVRASLWGGLLILAMQILLGGWVSTNYAVLACSTFPQCQGSWWPPMALDQAFDVWRPLGLLSNGEPISFAALTGIHYVHRLASYGVFAALACLAWRIQGVPGLNRPARALGALLALQLATGLSNVVLGWPLIAALLHTGGAAALVAVMSWMLALSRAEPRFPPVSPRVSRLPA